MAKKKRPRSIHQKAFGSKRPKFAPTPKLSGGGIRVGAMMDKQLRVGMMTSPDPGNGNEINIELNAQAYCEVVTAGAESRLLPPARGFGNGQELTVMLKVDGGNLTIVGAADGNVVLEDASDIAIFKVTQAGEDENDRVWRVVHESDAMVDAIHGMTGATDNAIIRADGTGGSDIQGSLVFISDTGWISADGGDGGLSFDADDVTYLKSEHGEPVLVILNSDGTDGGFHFNASGNGIAAANGNTFIGDDAGAANTSGINNIAIGRDALEANTSGQANVAVGNRALSAATTASSNTAVGVDALRTTITGASNTAVGRDALLNNTASSNTAVGANALRANTSGFLNTAVGSGANNANTTGAGNIAIGTSALNVNTDGGLNVAVGVSSLSGNTSGNFNTAVGYSALATNQTGANNVAVGYFSLLNATISGLTAVGSNSLKANTTGANNVAVGFNALKANTTASNNVAVGTGALITVQTAGNNVAIGTSSLGVTTTGDSNVAIGTTALRDNTSGAGNMACGSTALLSNTTGSGNLGMGVGALASVTTGSMNVGLGDSCGPSLTTGSGCIIIGGLVDLIDGNGDYQLNIGNCIIGNLDTGDIELYDGTSSTSFAVNNTRSSVSNYERGRLRWDSNVFIVDTEAAGTGTVRSLALATGGTTRTQINNAGVVASGSCFKPAYGVSTYAAGTDYSLTNTPAALDFGTTDPVITLAQAGIYKVSGWCVLEYNAATFAANQTVTLKLRRTNNTAADLANGTMTLTTEILTTTTKSFMVVHWEAADYTTANTNDSLTIFGDVSVVPSAGSLDVSQAFIKATRIS